MQKLTMKFFIVIALLSFLPVYIVQAQAKEKLELRAPEYIPVPNWAPTWDYEILISNSSNEPLAEQLTVDASSFDSLTVTSEDKGVDCTNSGKLSDCHIVVPDHNSVHVLVSVNLPQTGTRWDVKQCLSTCLYTTIETFAFWKLSIPWITS